jgi:hypothetical protein
MHTPRMHIPGFCSIFFLIHRFHSISFTRAQGIPNSEVPYYAAPAHVSNLCAPFTLLRVLRRIWQGAYSWHGIHPPRVWQLTCEPHPVR